MYLDTVDKYEASYRQEVYPIVPDTMSRTPREHALWNTPQRVRQKQARSVSISIMDLMIISELLYVCHAISKGSVR